MQHGNLQGPRFHLLVHHHRQQALGLEILSCLILQKLLKIRPQSRENTGGKAPEVHGDHRIRVQIPVLSQIPQSAVGVQLYLERFPHRTQLSILHCAHAAGNRTMQTGRVFGGLALRRQLRQLLVDRPVRINAVIVIGIDDAAGLMHHIRRAQQGVNRTKGLRPLRRDVVKRRHGGKILKGVRHFHRTAVQRRPPGHRIAAQLAHHFLHLRLDDKHYFIESGPQRIINGVLHQNFPVGADSIHLLAAAVAGTQSRRHNDQ